MSILKKVLKITAIVFLIILSLAALLLLFLTFTEYSPEPEENLSFASGERRPSQEDPLTVLSWNIGYSGLGAGEEFFMDGGKIRQPSESVVEGYLEGIKQALGENEADVYFLQEVDADSARSYGIDERESIASSLNLDYGFAINYKCAFVPFPIPLPGRVESGLQTLTDFEVSEAQRIQLPLPFKWPMRTANLKRCLLVERVPIGDEGKELVLVNLHLEAYDDGEGKAAQTRMLMGFVTAEYEKGNYVIAGGDWNQTFPEIDHSGCPVIDEGLWQPGVLESSMLPEGWGFAVDGSNPSCRLLNMPYTDDREVMQYYIIDGFVLSPNVKLSSVETLDYGFRFSDHQPVKITVDLLP